LDGKTRLKAVILRAFSEAGNEQSAWLLGPLAADSFPLSSGLIAGETGTSRFPGS
jgi:hypothetical protein